MSKIPRTVHVQDSCEQLALCTHRFPIYRFNQLKMENAFRPMMLVTVLNLYRLFSVIIP
jgi:hypothetical protein